MTSFLFYLMEGQRRKREEGLEAISIIRIEINIPEEDREYFYQRPEELSRRIYNIFSHDGSFYRSSSN